MPFGFGAKKKEEKAPPPPPEESANYAPPAGQPKAAAAAAAPANGGADDLFGGMTATTTTRRRGKTKKGDAPAEASETASVMSSENKQTEEPSTGGAAPPSTGDADQANGASPDGTESVADSNTAEKKPFTAPKFSFGGDDEGGFDGFQVEDPATAKLRTRLEKFYEKYNPQKLAKLDQTIEAYKGKEEKLFEALVSKYGPEPGSEGAAASSAEGAGGFGAGFSNTSKEDVSADGWGTGGGASDAGTGWGDDNKSSADNKTSGGDTGGAGGGWGTSNETTGGWGTSNNDEGGANGGGFASGFGDDDTAKKDGEGTTGFGSAEDAGTTSGGWGDNNGGSGGFGAATEGNGGFGDAANDDATGGFGGAGGFGDDSPAKKDGESGGGFGGGFGDASPENNNDASGGGGFGGFGDGEQTTGFGGGFGDSSQPAAADGDESSSSDDDDIPLWEQHQREIASAVSYVTEKQEDVATAVTKLAETISQRHAKQSFASQLEGKVDAAMAADDYEEAERLDEEFKRATVEVASLDEQCDAIPASISEEEEGLESAFLELASLAEQQGQSIKTNLAEEERKVDRHITETGNRVEQSSDKVAADLEKATRTMHNVEQEVVNLEQRRTKIEEKMNHQTEGLRNQRDELATAKKTVEEEIRELEETLAKKRRLLADKKMELGDVEEKLGIIMRDHEANLKDVDDQMEEEKKKLAASKSNVSNLEDQEEKVNREKAELAAETERLRAQLASQREKMTTAADVAEKIRSVGLVDLRNYYKTTLGAILTERQQGKGFLCTNPSSHPELAKINSSLAALDSRATEETSKQSAATLRLQEIAKSVPVLEAAKKAAAAAKQFKEAGAKTNEIKALDAEKVTVEEELKASQSKTNEIAQEQADLKAKKKVEEKAVAQKMEGFVLSYFALLQKAIDAASAGVGIKHWIEVISATESEASSDELDILAVATMKLLQVLDTECRATPVKLDGSLSAPGSPVSAGTPTIPTASDDKIDNAGAEPAASQEEETTPAVQEETSAEEPGAAAAEEKTPEEYEAELKRMEADLEKAMEYEDYDQCDAIQNRIDFLKGKLGLPLE